MTQIPSTLLDAPPPARDPGRPPGDPPDAPFASVLEDQARTATAEGRPRQTDRDGGADAPAPIGEEADAPSLVALLGGLPLPAGATPLDPATIASHATVAPPSGGPAPASSLPGEAAIPTGPAVPAAASSLPLGPAPSQTASPARGAATVTPSATPAATDGQTLPASATGSAGGQQPAAAARAEQPPLPTAATAAPSADGGTSASGRTEPAAIADRATAQPATTQPAPASQQGTAPAAPTASQPAATPTAAPTTPLAPTPGVRLAEAVETVKLAFRAAAERGVAHARIALSPRELGGIEIHLKQTADGLLARVVAEHQAAAQLLHTAAAELRRSLEAQGLTLLQLDVGTPGDEQGRGANGSGPFGFADGAAGDGRGSGARAGQRGADAGANRTDADADEEIVLGAARGTDPTTIALPNGALVDVLA